MHTKNNKTFKQECKIINLEIEYPGYKGAERYAIITDLSEEVLNARYSEQIEKYRPFIILSKEMGLAMKEFNNNEKKHSMRLARGEYYIGSGNNIDLNIPGLTVEDKQNMTFLPYRFAKE